MMPMGCIHVLRTPTMLMERIPKESAWRMRTMRTESIHRSRGRMLAEREGAGEM